MKNLSTVRQDYQLVNARYKLDTSEIKFVLACLTQIKKEDKEFCIYEIKISDLESKLQVEQNSTRLKSFAKKLMSKPLEVPTINGGWIVFNWFSKIQYVPDERKFLVRIDEDLKPYLLDLRERYVMFNLKYILPLASNYSIRIYQLLKEYESLTKRYFLVDELMDILQVPPSLRRYDNFKRKVLKVAELELFEHTDIAFTFEEEKEGKKVHRLVFRISLNSKIKHQNTSSNSKQLQLIDDDIPVSYSRYYGRNVKASDGTIYEHIIVITPFADGSLNIKFQNGETVRAESEDRLKGALI